MNMAYNKLRREIEAQLALEDPTTVEQQEKRARAIEAASINIDFDGSIAGDTQWQAFSALALNDRDHLIMAGRVLRKVLIALGGPVEDTRPTKVVDMPDAQIEHPVAVPPVMAEIARSAEEALNQQADDFYDKVEAAAKALCYCGDDLPPGHSHEAGEAKGGAGGDSLPSVSEETSPVDLCREFQRDVDPGDEGSAFDGYDERGAIDAFNVLDQQGR
jgi:hypothetical protein